MKNIHPVNADAIRRAAAVIRRGGLVGMPTETVYGLAADARNPQAVARIFEVKNRPSFNPLISHIADKAFLPEYARVDARAPALAERFWPGPLTFVLKRRDRNPAMDLACAGLDTLTVRMPDHAAALALIRESGAPLVAPSANKSQRVSPTTAQHVFHDLGEQVDMILDAGACAVGVESTIIDLTHPRARLLRAGAVSREELEEFLNERLEVAAIGGGLPRSPGQMRRHYAPRYPVRLNASEALPDEFFIGFGEVGRDAPLNLSFSGDLREASARLFAYLRQAEEQTRLKKIAVAPVPAAGLGCAINDRLTRAAAPA